MKLPKVSVVIPAYNHEGYVGEAIRSVLDQTFSDFELIIINDGSTDNTESEILKFKDDRIRYYSQENRGLSATLNRGLGLARGEYFDFLPSDDAFYPEKLEVQLRVFEGNPELGVVFSYPQLVDAEGREIKDDPAALWPIVPYETKEEIFPALFERNFLSAPTALIRMDCFKKVGLFDESLKYAQDYDLWMRILEYYDTRLIKQPLVRYRWHGENLTFRSTSETEEERKELLTKAYYELSVRDLFPSLASLQETDRPEDFGKAYARWARYLRGSGLRELVPFAETCEEAAKSLKGFVPRSALIPEEGGSDLDRGKINLLMETRSLDQGGLEEVIFNIARHLDRNLFRIVIVCVERGGRIAERCRKIGVPVEILTGDKEREYREVLVRYRIDLLITHYSTFGTKIASELEIPVISFLHNIYCWLPDEIFGEIKNADQRIDRYVAVSEDVKAYTAHRFNISPEKIVVIPNGIDLAQLELRKDSPNLTRKEAGFEETDYLFINIAAFTPAKAHPLILAAMKEVSLEHPEAKVLCIGSGLDPKYEEFVRAQIREHGLEKHVRLAHFTEDLHSYYKMADAFLLPSTIEGWSLAAMEAMAYGLPLILTRVGGASQMIESTDIGLLVDNRYPEIFDIGRSALEDYEGIPPNVSSLKEAMLRFLREKAYWKEAGKKAKAKVRERFDIRTVVKAYDLFFLSTVALHSTGIRGRLVTEKESLLKEGKRLSEEREQLIKTHETHEKKQEIHLKEMDDHLQQRGQEIQELRQLLETRYRQLDNKIEYVLVRMSVKERIRARLFKSLKTLHKLVPKRIREKYQFRYRRFFFDRTFPDRERFEAPIPSQQRPSNVLAIEEVKQFLGALLKDNSEHLMVIYTTDPYLESRGQRSTWLTKEFVRRGIPVVFFYWRWDPKEPIVKSKETLVFSIPIDEFQKVEKQLFSPSLNSLKKILLIEFPDSHLFEKVNLANAHSFITLYDCVDDWEEFAKAGQAIWYDAAVERYLVRNANLVLATNQRLAEKLKEMGASSVPIIPNGVDLKSFKPGTEEISLQRGTLTVGYFGHLTESWFDWDLITKTAQARKDWVFHIIGYGEPSGLKLPENVHFWGRVEHRDLPAYARFWDVAMIPFREGRLTEAVDPIKLYEYLYLGLPVVATNMVHLRGTPGVFPCLRDDFERTLILAKQTPFPRQEVEKFIQSNTWEKRVDQILEEIGRVDLSGDVLKSIG